MEVKIRGGWVARKEADRATLCSYSSYFLTLNSSSTFKPYMPFLVDPIFFIEVVN